MAGAEILGEALGALELGRGLRRAEDRDAGRPQIVGEARRPAAPPGPTTTRSIALSRQKAATAAWSATSSATQFGFLGDAGIARRGIELGQHAATAASFQASACSRPPEPMRRTFMPATPPSSRSTLRYGRGRAGQACNRRADKSPLDARAHGCHFSAMDRSSRSRPGPRRRRAERALGLPRCCRGRLWPYAQLARWDRPIGWQLLLWPCWWSAALAASAYARPGEPLSRCCPRPGIWCCSWSARSPCAAPAAPTTTSSTTTSTHKVERTRSRPLPSGQVDAAPGLGLPACCRRWSGSPCSSSSTASPSCSASPRSVVVAIYPFMKRIHQLAATGARACLLLGRADGLGGGVRRPRAAGGAALCRLDPVGDRLRHDLCPPGQGGRRAGRRALHGAAVRRAHQSPGWSGSMAAR